MEISVFFSIFMPFSFELAIPVLESFGCIPVQIFETFGCTMYTCIFKSFGCIHIDILTSINL